MKKALPFLLLIFLAVVAYYLFLKPVEKPEVNVEQNLTIDSSTTINQPEKKEYEVYSDIAKVGINKIAEGIDKTKEENRKRDSIRLANRSTFWAYKIGGSKSDPEDFKELYSSLNERVSNIYVFKVSRSEFFLIKYDGYAKEDQLVDKQEEVTIALQEAGVSDELQIKNLTNFCELKDDVSLIGKEKIARKVKVDCYSCK